MKIAIITTHSWPCPPPSRIFTGDNFLKDLAKSFDEMGHQVTFVAPAGSYTPPHGQFLELPCSWGKYPPTSQDCELAAFARHKEALLKQDIVHDFSISKIISESLNAVGFTNTIATPLGGNWTFVGPNTRNIVLNSKAMLERGLKGETDYSRTELEHMGGPPQKPIKNGRVVHLGISTDFYYPTYNKKNYFLFLGRWHIVRGYKQAIEVAKKSGIKLVMAGLDPSLEPFDAQRQCAYEAMELAKGISNISFELLPENNHHEKKRELLQEAKALILPTQFHEPFGLTMAEALACGTPVITTNYGSMPEIVTPDVGFTCNNTIDDFISALSNIERISHYNCRERAVKYFDRFVMARRYINQYQAVLAGEAW